MAMSKWKVVRVRGAQERLESNEHGRALINGFLVFTLAAMLVSNLPASSALNDHEQGVFRNFLFVTGLRQRWGVFSPNPTQNTVFVTARIDYADGGTQTWTFPQGERTLGTYRSYRWRMFGQDVQGRSTPLFVTASFADWVVRTKSDPNREVNKITLVRTAGRTRPPGEDGPVRSWRQEEFYSATVDGGP
jgi:hypothetical protein